MSLNIRDVVYFTCLSGWSYLSPRKRSIKSMLTKSFEELLFGAEQRERVVTKSVLTERIDEIPSDVER